MFLKDELEKYVKGSYLSIVAYVFQDHKAPVKWGKMKNV